MSGAALNTRLKAAARKSLPESVVSRLRNIGSSVFPWRRISSNPAPAINKPLIVYLARRHEGAAVFRRFIESYRNFADDTPHDLLIIFKGFPTRSSREEYYRVLDNVTFIELKKSDIGFDIGSFRKASEHFSYSHYLFLNSFCRILCENYLTKLLNCLSTAPRAGLVGPSGSWEQGCSSAFPNYHIRTSAFFIGRDVLTRVRWPVVITKYDAYQFEHGRKGLSRQIVRLGLKLYVVRADGRWCGEAEWPYSSSFRSGEQEQLMVADKQTDIYASSDDRMRDSLRKRAWEPRERSGLASVGLAGW